MARLPSLRLLLALAFGTVSAVLSGVFALLIAQSALRHSETEIGDRMGALAHQLAVRLDQGMYERYRDVLLLASAAPLRDRQSSVAELRASLERRQSTNKDWAWIAVVDAETAVVVAATGGVLENTDLSSRPWWRNAIEVPFVGDVHPAILLARLLPRTSEEEMRFLDIAAPVRDEEGRVTAIVAGHLHWSWVVEAERNVLDANQRAGSIEALIVSREGVVTLGPPDLIGTRLDVAALTAGDPDRIVTWPNGKEYVTGVHASTGYRDYPGLGWTVLVRQPTEVAFAPVHDLRWFMLSAALSVLIVMLAMSYVVANWIAAPLSVLSQNARNLRLSGHPGQVEVPRLFAEAHALATELNTLFTGLARSDSALQVETASRDRAEHFLSAVIGAAPVAVIVLDPEGRITVWNAAATTITGVDGNSLMGQAPPLMRDNDPRPQAELLAEMRAAQKPIHEEVTLRRPDGKTTEARLIKTALHNGDGTLRGYLYLMEDVTQRRTTERQLQHAQKMEAVGQLTGGVAHDFNNLLTVIVGNLDLLADDFPMALPPDATERVEAVRAAALRGANLTRHLLALSRRQVLQPRTLEVADMLAGLGQMIRRTLGADINVVLPPLATETWPIHVDPGQLETGLLNLAINARDAMPRGGTLTLEAVNTTVGNGNGHPGLAPGDYVAIAVSDTGSGIPPEILDRVFEPFFTTKEAGRGTGLGLAMVYGFARQSGGIATIYSEPGYGTTVRLYLPRATAVEAERPAAIGAVPRGDGACILVVEDRDDVRTVVTQQITALGYTVLAAADGESALSLLGERPDVALLFTDIAMPGSMSGAEVAAQAGQLRPKLPVLFTTGFAEQAVSDRLPVNARVLVKPYRLPQLAQALAGMLKPR